MLCGNGDWPLPHPRIGIPVEERDKRHTQQEEVILLIRGYPGWNVWALPRLCFTRQETVPGVEIPREER